MKSIVTIAFLFMATAAFAQTPTSALSTDPQEIENLIQATGCRAEVTAAAQTIANLQKQINDLQKQLNAKDPPKKK
jgi:polyhydroxyalkanoate synthesis regulator phasin